MSYRLSRIVTRTGDGGTTGLANGARCSKASARIHALGEVDELNACLGLLGVAVAEVAEVAEVAATATAEVAGPGLPAETAVTAGSGLRAVLAMVERAQQTLFDLGAVLALPGRALGGEGVAALEVQIAALNAALPPLTEFVVPGGNRAAAQAHVARAVCRRAERAVVALLEAEAADTAGRGAVEPRDSDRHDPPPSARGGFVDPRSAADAAGQGTAEALRYLNRLSDLLFVLARTLHRQGGGPEAQWDRSR
jgi:cob(I)alamin adenosyltransferase